MALSINTNLFSVNAQRNLTKVQNPLQTAMQRLSSGLRISTAKDDAAGLAISERMNSQVRGLNQAARNANDGVSLAQTAEGAQAEITNNLQRIRELAVQSINSSNSSSDRTALQSEVAQLASEIDRVAAQTTFNGITLLDGTFTTKTFQVGADSGNTISITSITSARTSAMGQYMQAGGTGAAVSSAAITPGSVTITPNGGSAINVTASVAGGAAGQTTDSAYAKAIAINGTAGTGVTATANATAVTGAAITAFTAITAGDLTINGISVGGVAAGGNAAGQAANIVQAVNSVSATTGVTASVNGTSDGVNLSAADGRNIVIAHAGASSSAAITGFTAATTRSTLTFTSTASFSVGGTAAIIGANASYTAALTGSAISAIDISTANGASSALASIDAALTTINSSRASLGAYQNRFTSAVASLQAIAENITAARSRIVDADFAAETANMTKSLIMQQAGISVLAQANTLPQQVLALLSGR